MTPAEFSSTLVFYSRHEGRRERTFAAPTPAEVLRQAFAGLRSAISSTGDLRAFGAGSIPCRRGVLNFQISRKAGGSRERTTVEATLNEYVEHGGRFRVAVSRAEFAAAVRSPASF